MKLTTIVIIALLSCLTNAAEVVVQQQQNKPNKGKRQSSALKNKQTKKYFLKLQLDIWRPVKYLAMNRCADIVASLKKTYAPIATKAKQKRCKDYLKQLS